MGDTKIYHKIHKNKISSSLLEGSEFFGIPKMHAFLINIIIVWGLSCAQSGVPLAMNKSLRHL